MRHVQPEHIDPGMQEFLENLEPGRRRPNSRHNFRATSSQQLAFDGNRHREISCVNYAILPLIKRPVDHRSSPSTNYAFAPSESTLKVHRSVMDAKLSLVRHR